MRWARWTAAALVVVAAVCYLGSRESVIATTGDGAVDVVQAEYGDTIVRPVRWSMRRPWPFLPERLGPFSESFLTVRVRSAAVHSRATVVGRCGCRFPALQDHASASEGESVVAFLDFPRRDATLRLEFDGLASRVAEFPSPTPPPPPASDAGVDDLPVVARVGAETWILAPDPQDAKSVVVRAAGADRSGFEWAFVSAHFDDASGNRVSRASDRFLMREHRLVLPIQSLGSPHTLCPHEPWWELTVNVTTSKTVTFRFRPPR